MLRHPEGDREDIMRWAAKGEKPVAELEYRPGSELTGSDRITAILPTGWTRAAVARWKPPA
jgi:hypothetical protein